MKELALHILDITQNSIRAGARVVKLTIDESTKENRLTIIIEDDGKGIPAEKLPTIADPFVTSRTTRKVGLGLSLFKAAAEACNGHFQIQSKEGIGTTVEATFEYDHIDRVPLGNMAETVVIMLLSFSGSELIYRHCYNHREFIFDTREIKEILQEESLLNDPEILEWIRGYIEEGLDEIKEE